MDRSNARNLTTRPWAILAYWEYRKRIGEQFKINDNIINITTVSQHSPDRQIAFLALDSVFTRNSSGQNGTSDSILKVRQKIGAGIILLRDDDNNVWLYNCSTASVFVNSPSLEPPKFPRQAKDICAALNAVTKVMPGDLIKVFDIQIVLKIKSLWQSEVISKSNPFATFHSFRVSFVKGFGEKYARSDLTQCPCWLEVMLTDDSLCARP